MSDSSLGQAPSNTVTTAPTAPEIDLPGLRRLLERQGLTGAKAGVVIQEITKSFSGPLPPAEDFAAYDLACPGAARDILDMAIRQQKHRHFVEKGKMFSEFLLPVIGIVAAVSVIGGLVFAGVYLALNNHDGLALAAFSGTGAATIAGAFITQRKKKSDKVDANQKRRR